MGSRPSKETSRLISNTWTGCQWFVVLSWLPSNILSLLIQLWPLNSYILSSLHISSLSTLHSPLHSPLYSLHDSCSTLLYTLISSLSICTSHVSSNIIPSHISSLLVWNLFSIQCNHPHLLLPLHLYTLSLSLIISHNLSLSLITSHHLIWL